MFTNDMQDKLRAKKTKLRQLAHQSREQQPDRIRIGEKVCQKILILPEYLQSETICSYVGVGNEVLTQNFINNAMLQGKNVLVPYVHRGHLCLFHLQSLDELATAPFGLLEPRRDLRNYAQKEIAPVEVDLFLVPGLAFGMNGERLGHGKGYYDNLLRHASEQAHKIGVCFSSQIMEEIPMFENDVHMDTVITENNIYQIYLA